MPDLNDPIPEEEFPEFIEGSKDPFEENIIEAKIPILIKKFDDPANTEVIDAASGHCSFAAHRYGEDGFAR